MLKYISLVFFLLTNFVYSKTICKPASNNGVLCISDTNESMEAGVGAVPVSAVNSDNTN